MFEAEGLLVLSVRRDWNRLGNLGLRMGRKVKDRDIILFNQELVAMIKAGYPILKSLESIASRVKNIHLREILIDVAGEVKKGKALSEAFQPYEKLFSTVYTASLMAGEKGGNLPASIGRYIQYAKMVTQTRARIKSAMTYPTILIVFSFILMGLLMNFVIPQFADFYKSFEAEMPRITKTVMAVAVGLNRHWYILAGLVAAAAVAGFPGCGAGRTSVYQVDRFKLRVPFGKTIWLESGISLFSRTLGLLLEAGISLLSAIGIAIQAVPNAWIVRHMKDVPDAHQERRGPVRFPGRERHLPAPGPGHGPDRRELGQPRRACSATWPTSTMSGFVVKSRPWSPWSNRWSSSSWGSWWPACSLSVYIPIFNIIRVAR